MAAATLHKPLTAIVYSVNSLEPEIGCCCKEDIIIVFVRYAHSFVIVVE